MYIGTQTVISPRLQDTIDNNYSFESVSTFSSLYGGNSIFCAIIPCSRESPQFCMTAFSNFLKELIPTSAKNFPGSLKNSTWE